MLRNLRYTLNTTTPDAPVPTIHYELTNHLGNVMAVITDEPTATETPAVESLTDYYPFGMTMPGRSYNAHTSRHGFTGHEKESDLAEGIYTTEYRLYDVRVGRWLSVDPLFEKYVGMSPYNYCAANPVVMVDPDGRRSFSVTKEDGTIEQIEIPDGVDGSFNIAQFDFDLLQETFNSYNGEYEDFFSSLGLGTKGYEAALVARSYEGNTQWAYDKEKKPIPEGYWKCNQFVYDVLVEVGAIKKIKPGQKLPQAKDHFTNTPRLNGTYKVQDGSVKLGDVVAGKYDYSDATGHVEIVSYVYPKWKEITGNLESIGAHEKSVYKSDKGAKMLSGSEHYDEIVVRRAK